MSTSRLAVPVPEAIRRASPKGRHTKVPAAADNDFAASELATPEPVCAHSRLARISWARLLKRVFGTIWSTARLAVGQLKIIAAILESAVIERVLTHLGLQVRAPPRALARADFRRAA